MSVKRNLFCQELRQKRKMFTGGKNMNIFKRMGLFALTGAVALSTMAAPAFAENDSSAPSYTPGVYEGIAEGRFGPITVEVRVSDNAIEEIVIKEHHDSDGVSDLPLTRIPKEIVEYQSLNVDSVSGATLTSGGIKRAVADAVQKAGGDADALWKVPVEYAPMPTDDMTTQIVVVGSGMAGITAASAAAQNGAQVTLVEKLPYLGGTLIMAGGYMVTVDSDSIDPELDDSLDRVDTYYHAVNEDSVRPVDYNFFKAIVSRTGEAIDYFKEKFGLETETFDAGNVIMTHHLNHGAGIVKQLSQYIVDNGVTIVTDTPAIEILMEDGKATGVRVRNRSGEYNIYADKVIIAAGGATWDLESLRANEPAMATIDLYQESVIGDNGDAFRMLEAAGAQMGDGPFIKSEVPNLSVVFKRDWKTTPFPSDKLMVNAEGRRFANENPLLNYMLNTYLLREASPAYYAIYDTAHTPDAELLAQIQELSASGNPKIAVHADTIEELAEKINMDPAVLRETYDAYQAACATGVDEEFGKDADHLIAYDDSDGLYAVYFMPASLGTIGGAITDEQFHVLDKDGNVIENLFAIGESATSTLFGDYYVGSFSLGMYLTEGKISAETAVAELNG